MRVPDGTSCTVDVAGGRCGVTDHGLAEAAWVAEVGEVVDGVAEVHQAVVAHFPVVAAVSAAAGQEGSGSEPVLTDSAD